MSSWDDDLYEEQWDNNGGFRRFVFTVNNPTALPVGIDVEGEDGLRFIIFQLEMAPNTGTPHYQGYLEVASPWRVNRVVSCLQDLCGAHPWVRPARGSPEKCIAYCSKEEDRLDGPWRFGKQGGSQGKRNDLDAVKDFILSGHHDMLEIATAFFDVFLKYGRNLEKYVQMVLMRHPRQFKSDVTVLIGPPGCGKSKWCSEQGSIEEVYWKPNNKWWDGYAPTTHSIVVLDDFYGWLPWVWLLNVLDRYPLQVENKGSSLPFLAKRVLITSNTDPRAWYKNQKVVAKFPAFARRVNRWILYDKDSIVYDGPSYDEFEQNRVQVMGDDDMVTDDRSFAEGFRPE